MKEEFKKIIIFTITLFCLTIGMSLSAYAAVSDMTQSEYDSKVNAFTSDSRWKNGASFGSGRTPYISSWTSWGCFAYTADFVKYMFGREAPQYGDSFTNASEIRAGDVLYADSTPHYVVVLSRSGNNLRTAEGNWGGAVRITDSAYYISGSSVLCRNWSGFYYNKAYHQVNIKSDDSQPTYKNTWVKTNKELYNTGETVNFTFEYKYGTSVSLGIDRNGLRYATPEVTGKTSYSMSFSEPGTYTVYVSGWSQSGYEDSPKITFIVDSGVSSSDTWIKADKTTCYIGETVNFTFGYKYTTSVSLGIDKWSGGRLSNPEVTGKNSYSCSFDQTGLYTVYVSGWSYSGYEDSGKVVITVTEPPVSVKSNVETYSDICVVKSSISNLKQNAVLVATLYSSNGELINTETVSVTNGSVSANTAISGKSNAAYIKVFLWDSLNGMKPLCESQRIDL